MSWQQQKVKTRTQTSSSSSHARGDFSRGRISSAEIFNIVEERASYVKDVLLGDVEDSEITILGGLIVQFLRKFDSEERLTNSTMERKKWGRKVQTFVELNSGHLKNLKIEITPSLKESLREIFFTYLHTLQVDELKNEINKLENDKSELLRELDTARSTYEPRQILEEIVRKDMFGVGYSREKAIHTLLMGNERFQQIFNRLFNDVSWGQKKIIAEGFDATSLPEKAQICKKLFNQCYSIASREEIHGTSPIIRCGSAPCGVIAKKENYNFHQRKFLSMVAEFLNRPIQFI